MVGLLSQMEDTNHSMVDPSDSATDGRSDEEIVGERQDSQNSNSIQKSPEVQQYKDNETPLNEKVASEEAIMTNINEAEDVKELKSILKRRGQYTMRKVNVDFDLIPKLIPFDETKDYTIEITILEKEPVKIKSWAALFAAKKAEAEAEAAATAEADAALKKAEEAQKKKSNKGKIVKREIHIHRKSESGSQPNLESKMLGTVDSENSKDVVEGFNNTAELVGVRLDPSETILRLENLNENQDNLRSSILEDTPLTSLVDDIPLQENRVNSVDSEKKYVPEEILEAAADLIEVVLAETPVILSRAVSMDEDLVSEQVGVGEDLKGIGEVCEESMSNTDPDVSCQNSSGCLQNADENDQNVSEPVQITEPSYGNLGIEGRRKLSGTGEEHLTLEVSGNESGNLSKENLLRNANPYILETAVEILNEIEKVTLAVVENLETPLP